MYAFENYMHVYMHLCMYACVGHRTTLGVVPQLFTWVLLVNLKFSYLRSKYFLI